MNNSRICVLIDGWFPIYGGGQIHVWETVNRLISVYHYQIDVYTRALRDENNVVFSKDENLLNNNLNIYRIGYPTKFFNIFGRISYLISIYKILKRHRTQPYSIMHAHAYFPIIPAKIIQLITKLPLVITVHGVGINAWKNFEKNKLLAKINHFVEKYLVTKVRCNKIISVSEDYLNYKNVNKDIIVIPNGVDANRFDKIKIDKKKKFTILYVGRFNPEKGVAYLIKAVSLIRNNLNNAEVRLIGEGLEKNNYQKLINVHNLNKIIAIVGKKYGEQVVKEYKSAHLFVLPSIYEGQPLSLLEAWAARLPVIATNVGDNKKFVKNEFNGYLIEPLNKKILAETILKALNNADLPAMGNRGYDLVKKNYSWENTVKKMNIVYNSLNANFSKQ